MRKKSTKKCNVFKILLSYHIYNIYYIYKHGIKQTFVTTPKKKVHDVSILTIKEI